MTFIVNFTLICYNGCDKAIPTVLRVRSQLFNIMKDKLTIHVMQIISILMWVAHIIVNVLLLHNDSIDETIIEFAKKQLSKPASFPAAISSHGELENLVKTHRMKRYFDMFWKIAFSSFIYRIFGTFLFACS